jgi:hypothetical protein
MVSSQDHGEKKAASGSLLRTAVVRLALTG